jgi:acyl-coenzyme A synthetase/AMP-(fatty) acid ligase
MSASFSHLSQLLLSRRSGDTAVATSGREVRTWGDLLRDVSALAAALGDAERERWLLLTDDAYAFAVGLLALWQRGAVAVLAPNAQPGTIERLGLDAAGLVSDREELLSAPPGPRALHPLTPGPGLPGQRVALAPDAPAVELFTSGSTGDGKAVPKALRHLEREVAVLEACFGPRIGPARVLATASHQHLYGLLFRVLWPLCAGRCFRAESYLHPEEILPRMVEDGPCALVSTPAHLRRLRALEGLGSVSDRCRAVFSSGGPLDEETADALAQALGGAPFEIFGSTETGGVAWRRQAPGPERLAWTPFEGVRMEREPEEGRARVRSAVVSVGGPDGFVMGDRVTLLGDGRFRLEGRADRVVKVGEKRLSLPEMESQLREHPFVSEAALLLLEKGSFEGRIGAAIVLSDAGRRALQVQGRRPIGLALAEHLEAWWDRVLLPRAWRYVSELPVDARGKTTLAALRELFAAPEEEPRSTEPELLAERRSACGIERRLRVPPDLVFLAGHFPGFPVVPGVVQLRWVMAAAADVLGAEPEVAQIEALKFHELLLPGQDFDLAVELAPEGRSFRFRLADGARVFASGRCRLVGGAEEDAP